MPTKSTLNETPRAVASDDTNAGQNPDHTVADPQSATGPSTSAADGISFG